MESISKYNLSFQDQATLKKRRALTNIKGTCQPFFLPKINLHGIQGEKEKYQNANIVLHVRGIGRNTQTEDKDPKKVWKRKRGKKSTLNSLSSPGNKSVGRDAIFLPPIESSRIVSQSTDVSVVLGKTEPQHCRFDFAIDALMNVIERHREERELNRERFHNDIIRGQQKPINENPRYRPN